LKLEPQSGREKDASLKNGQESFMRICNGLEDFLESRSRVGLTQGWAGPSKCTGRSLWWSWFSLRLDAKRYSYPKMQL